MNIRSFDYSSHMEDGLVFQYDTGRRERHADRPRNWDMVEWLERSVAS